MLVFVLLIFCISTQFAANFWEIILIIYMYMWNKRAHVLNWASKTTDDGYMNSVKRNDVTGTLLSGYSVKTVLYKSSSPIFLCNRLQMKTLQAKAIESFP